MDETAEPVVPAVAGGVGLAVFWECVQGSRLVERRCGRWWLKWVSDWDEIVVA